MKKIKYKYCGEYSEIESFEDLVSKITGDSVYHSDEEYCHRAKNSCFSCKRNESLKYCGESFPEIGVYTGDHYDDVISAIINYFNEL